MWRKNKLGKKITPSRQMYLAAAGAAVPTWWAYVSRRTWLLRLNFIQVLKINANNGHIIICLCWEHYKDSPENRK